MKPSGNISASVRQRLLNRSRNELRPFSELLQYYAMERFLYRLSRSAHVDHFILKGAMMLRVWRSSEFRPTMDIDMLGKTNSGENSIKAQIRDILGVNVNDDGLSFDADTILTERISEDAENGGIRIRFRGALGTAVINMQVDIGFGDVVHPEPVVMDIPTILDMPAPRMLCYSRESSIAEKFEAMVRLGMLNSRMKDFYDIWLLCRLFNFDGANLTEAIRLTFERRGTVVPTTIEAFNPPFIEAKQIQWKAFRKRLQQDHVPVSFKEIITLVDSFLRPVTVAISTDKSGPTTWNAPGPWT